MSGVVVKIRRQLSLGQCVCVCVCVQQPGQVVSSLLVSVCVTTTLACLGRDLLCLGVHAPDEAEGVVVVDGVPKDQGGEGEADDEGGLEEAQEQVGRVGAQRLFLCACL